MKAAMYWTKLKCLYLLQEERIFFSEYFSSSTGSFPTTLSIRNSRILRHPVYFIRLVSALLQNRERLRLDLYISESLL
jgi:hypothetical protein